MGARAATGRPTGQTRYTVPAAAEVLGITAEAVRSRIKRGMLPTDREAGAVFGVLEADRATEEREGGPEEGRRRSWWREFFGFGE